ncbi:MAG: MoaD/ThiS family protein [Candidatus Heimdallarchaeota archaeon]|nr:MAG: MoaD/ThiS family protein [Candidatus Heimdallarchaeota archaeon]
MKIHLKFLGSLQYDLKQQNLPYQISSEKSVRDIVSELTQNPQFKELKSFFTETLEKKRSLLIFINEQEISVLDGMRTKVKAEATIAFIPVIHGGMF